MVAGAAEAPIVAPYYSLFALAGVMSRQTENPKTAMRPFDVDRDGFVIGEGSAFLILEELGHAISRGARIYCEWAGHGQSCEAFSSFSLHPEGRGMKRALQRLFSTPAPFDAIRM